MAESRMDTGVQAFLRLKASIHAASRHVYALNLPTRLPEDLIFISRSPIERAEACAREMGCAAYFVLTFSLAFPAYLFLPWVSQMLAGAAAATNSGRTGGRT